MIDIIPTKVFPFCYQSNDASDDLFVQARIYEVSTGTPIFLGSVVMELAGDGLYGGTYLALAHKAYLVIISVYTDDTYETIDDGRSPVAECYRCLDATTSLMLLNYGAYDQDITLDVAAKIYDVTDGSPVLVDTVAMPEVFAGVYFCAFTGEAEKSYVVNKSVYTDDTFEVLNSERPSGSDQIQLITPGVVYNFTDRLILTGQSLSGVLEGQC